MFFGESMFSAASGGSKVALAALAHRLRQWDWPLIAAPVENGHLLRLGAESWPRPDFIATIGKLCRQPAVPEPWTERFGELRSEERRGGSECVSPGSARGCPCHYKRQKTETRQTG